MNSIYKNSFIPEVAVNLSPLRVPESIFSASRTTGCEMFGQASFEVFLRECLGGFTRVGER